MSGEYYYIPQYELNRKLNVDGNGVQSHIQLVAPDFRDDKRPAKLLDNALGKIASREWKYVGVKKGEEQDVDLRRMLKTKLKDMQDDKNAGFSAFVQPYTIKGKQELSFKQMIDQKRSEQALAHEAAMTASARSAEERRRGIYRVQNQSSVSSSSGTVIMLSKKAIDNLREKYDPKKLQVAPGVYDFTKAHGYDEDLTRHNLNIVNRPNTV